MSKREKVTVKDKGYLTFTCRCGDVVTIDTRALYKELELLRAIAAPLLRHAERDDYSPPYMFNVCECRKIREGLKCL